MTTPLLVKAWAPAELANWSNLALYSAMAVYTIAMLLFASHLAELGPDTSADASADASAAGAGADRADSADRDGELVGAVAGSVAGSVAGRSVLDGSSPTSSVTATPTGSSSGFGDDGTGGSLRARKLGATGMSMTWLASILLLASVVLRGLSVARAPWGNMFEFATAGATVAAFAYLLLARRHRWEWLGIFVVGPILLTLGTALLAFYTEAAELMPALKSVWLVIHVTVAILAVGLFIVAFGLGVAYLLKVRRDAAEVGTRSRRLAFLDSLPSATRLERSAYGLNMVGFILWTFTLVAGAIWAQKAWGSYWTWDPKEVWTFVVWVVYAAYMHARATAGWEPRKAMWIAIAAFATVIVNFAVVNVFFVGQHSYSGL